MFTKEEEIFIIEEFAKLPSNAKSPTVVKGAFCQKYRNTGPRSIRALNKIDISTFMYVYQKFKNNGVQNIRKKPEFPIQTHTTDPEKIKKVQNYYAQYQMNSIYQASRDLEIPITTLKRICHDKLGMKAYKPNLVQTLSKAQKQQRLTLCQWILEQSDETISHIIFRDEKWFQLSQHPNKQNTRYWSVSKPNFVFDLKNQHVSKVMAFVIIVEGQAFLYWHENEQGKNVSVNSAQYIKSVAELLENIPLQKLKILIWSQDGAPCHTSKVTMQFLKSIFKDRIISRFSKSDTMPEWSAHSPDLNPLDYTFWGQAMAKVWEAKPTSKQELKNVVEQFFSSLSPDFVKKCTLNIRKRAQLCVQQKGGHIEHLL